MLQLKDWIGGRRPGSSRYGSNRLSGNGAASGENSLTSETGEKGSGTGENIGDRRSRMLGWEAVVGLEKLPPPALMSLAAPRGDLFPDGVLMILGAGARLKDK